MRLSRTKWRNLRINNRLNMSLPTREAGMKDVQTHMNLLHALKLCALKGNEHLAPRTQITF
jgi:hypothetical protein